MIRVCLALALTLLLPGLAAAGAWPREKGTGFASATSYLSWAQDYTTWVSYAPAARYDTLYLEYGLTDRWTVGLDLGRSVSGGTKLVAFVRYPLGERLGIQIAPELGIGQIEGKTVIRPGLSLGKGVARGWAAADFAAELFPETGNADAKLDLTLGMNLGARRAMVQFQTGQQTGDEAFLRIVPSVTTPLGKRFDLELGVSYGVLGDTSMGLKLGLWTEF